MVPNAFVSYSRADWHCVELIAAALRRLGIETWVDIENIHPGDQWKDAVNEAIRRSDGILFCISPLCLESGRTLTELRKALAQSKAVFPVMIERVEFEDLPRELSDLHVVQIWQEPPIIGAAKAARAIASKMLPDLTFGDEAGYPPKIGKLVLNVGGAETGAVHTWLSEDAAPGAGKAMERSVTGIGDLQLVEHWVGNASAVYLAIGEDAVPDLVTFYAGYVLAVVGRASMCLLTESHFETAATLASELKLRHRYIQELGASRLSAALKLAGSSRDG